MRQDKEIRDVEDIIDEAASPERAEWAELFTLIQHSAGAASLLRFIKERMQDKLNELLAPPNGELDGLSQIKRDIEIKAEFNALRVLVAQIVSGIQSGNAPEEKEEEDNETAA